MSRSQEDKQRRCKQVNEFIRVIASCGRNFFRHDEAVASFDVDDRGRVWFTDEYTKRRIYTHTGPTRRWRGFRHGGTMKRLIYKLKNYIVNGSPCFADHLGPWPDWISGGDLWGYGEDMDIVREHAELMLKMERVNS